MESASVLRHRDTGSIFVWLVRPYAERDGAMSVFRSRLWFFETEGAAP
jgi:hypothetical protein